MMTMPAPQQALAHKLAQMQRDIPRSKMASHVRLIEAWGKRRTVTEWSVLSGQCESGLRQRLGRGWPAEVAISLPPATRVDMEANPGAPMSWTWDVLPWRDDPWAQAFVRAHPDGGSLEEVGKAIGVTRERVRQLEESALMKLRIWAEER